MKEINKKILVIDDDREIWQAYSQVLVSSSAGDSAMNDLNLELDEMLGESTSKDYSFDLSFAGQGQEGFITAKEALEKENPFALAFVDIRMPPGWNGMETAAELHKLDPDLEIIIVTAYADHSCEEIVNYVGAPHKLLFFRKPFDPEELRQIAISLTDKWNIARQDEIRRRELVRLNEEMKKQMEEIKSFQAKQLELERELHQAQKMEAIGLMAGGVAHDLNNILSGLVSYPDLLLQDLPEDNPMRKPIGIILESGKRAAAVVADLLTVARGAASEKKVADLNTLIREYLQSPEGDNLKSFYPNVKIETKFTKGANICCSPIHIKKCLMNLITNAAEAIGDDGTIFITTDLIQPEEANTESDDDCPSEYVMLSVTDTGPGIPQEDLEHIFEPFYTKKVMGRSGTGLGLTLVWNTVQNHKGEVSVESTEKGTTFHLYFPVTTEKIIDQEKPASVDDLKGQGKILIVDDDHLQRSLTRQMLEKLGYTVHTVDSGEKAVAYLKNENADLVILDMIMDPGMDGCQTYEEIVQFKPNQKAIMISGFSENDRVVKAQGLGAGGYIKKPFSMEQIGRAIKKELSMLN